MSLGRKALHILALLSASALAFALGFLAAETRQVVAARLERQAALELARQPAIEVARIRLEARPFRERLQAVGTIEPWRSARLAFAESGGVREVLADVGDAVHGPGPDGPGQPLARLDLERLRAWAEAAAADLAQARWDLERLEPLLRKGQVSQEAWRRAQLVVDLKAAEKTRADKALADAELRAPFSGIVAERFIEVGEAASPMAPAFRLIEMERVKALIHLPSGRVDEIRPGLDAEVRIALGRDRVLDLRGTVLKAIPSAKGRLFPVEIALDNPEGQLKQGMLANAVVFTRTNPRVFVLPLEAVIERRGRRMAMLFEERGRIVTGRFDLGRLGEHARERIVTELGDGAEVGRWNPLPEARWEALGLSARERVLARSAAGPAAEPIGIGLEVFRYGSIARERELPSAWIEGDLCLVPDDESIRDGELLIVRGQHRLSDGAEVILSDRNEMPLPTVGDGPGEDE